MKATKQPFLGNPKDILERALKLPFTTNYQEEAQDIVKNLWKEQVINFGKLWIKSATSGIKKEYPNVYIMKDDTDNVQIMVDNFEKYIPFENLKIMCSDEDSLMGVSILSIMDTLQPIFREVNTLHQKIINIYESSLDIETKKYFIKLAIIKIDKSLEEETYLLNFTYPKNIIQNLNDLHEYHDWIDNYDSFVISLALDAYRDITHYYEWIDTHQISDKHFKEKKVQIQSTYKSSLKYFGIENYYHRGLPRHPQDILHSLFYFYSEYYNREMRDNGVQSIMQIISNYERTPKLSKSKKESDQKLKELSKSILTGEIKYIG